MATSVLGKRTRSCRDSTATPHREVITRSAKRQARCLDSPASTSSQFTIFDDSVSQNGASMEVEDKENILPSSSSRLAKPPPSPLQRRTTQERLPLSPRRSTNESDRAPSSSPLKQSIGLPSPQTPRHRDALSKRPVTPRHRVSVTARSASPMTPRTAQSPRTPGTSSSYPTIYSRARQMFTLSSNPGRLIQRDAERAEIQEFVRSHLADGRGGCLYISGPPGTGKSALVNEILSSLEEAENVMKVFMNCMSIKDAKMIYGKLVEELISNDNTSTTTTEDPVKTMQKLFLPRSRSVRTTYLVSLDEIDHLLAQESDTLTQLFEWSLQPSSRLILVGIANALDLTDRFLPRLKARNIQPNLIPFMPYTTNQIAAVITTKLRSLSTPQADGSPASGLPPFIHPTAITFLAKKVSSSTGDLRKAFELCRQAINLVESEVRADHQAKILQLTPTKPSPLTERLINLTSPPTPEASPVKSRNALSESLAALIPETAPRVTIAHMSKVAAQLNRSASVVNRLSALNLQQKACLCALLVHERMHRNDVLALEDPLATRNEGVGMPTLKRLYPRYSALCREDGCLLTPLSATEFKDVAESLETLGVVSLGGTGKGKGGLFAKLQPRKAGKEETRISLMVDEKEVEEACKGVAGGALMRMLLGS